MPLFRRKKKTPNMAGDWVTMPELPADQQPKGDQLAPRNNNDQTGVGTPVKSMPKNKKVFRVVTVRGKQEQAWLDSGLWQPQVETVIPEEARAPLTVVYYGTYGSDGMRHDGAPGGGYSSVFDQHAMKGGDPYTRDESRTPKQWDTRKPFPGFDPKLGSKTLDIYSED